MQALFILHIVCIMILTIARFSTMCTLSIIVVVMLPERGQPGFVRTSWIRPWVER